MNEVIKFVRINQTKIVVKKRDDHDERSKQKQ